MNDVIIKFDPRDFKWKRDKASEKINAETRKVLQLLKNKDRRNRRGGD